MMQDLMTANSPSEGVLISPPSAPSNLPSRMNEEEILALPFIGIYAGVDELVPTKAVYAIYEPRTDSLRFVRGDGKFIDPEQICFMERFWNASSPQASGTDGLLTALYANMIRYREMSNSGNWDNAASFRARFSTTCSVKSALTYVSDLKFGLQTNIPALQIFALDEFTENQEDEVESCIRRPWNPKWDFSPLGYQPLIQLDVSEEWRTKHARFVERYGAPYITFMDFQQALYCLVGMHKVGFVSLVHASPRVSLPCVQGFTSDLRKQVGKTFKTTNGWKVEGFVARFKRWETFRDDAQGLLHFANPVRWLEADLRREEMQTGKPRQVDENEYSDVVSWEDLMQLQWTARPGYTLTVYPRPFVSKPKQPLHVRDFMCQETSKFEELNEARFGRAAKEKSSHQAEEARKVAEVENADCIDLSHDDPLFVDHRNSARATNPHTRSSYGSNDPFANDFDVYFHGPMNHSALRKRVRSPPAEFQPQQSYHYGGESSQSSTRLTKQRLTAPRNRRSSQTARKTVEKPLITIDEDIYGISDEERARSRKRLRPSYENCYGRSHSPPRVFKIPPGWKIFGDGIHGPAATRPPKTPNSHTRTGSLEEDCPYPTPLTTQDTSRSPCRRSDWCVEDQELKHLTQQFGDLAERHAPQYFEEKVIDSSSRLSDTQHPTSISATIKNSAAISYRAARTSKRSGCAEFCDYSNEDEEERPISGFCNDSQTSDAVLDRMKRQQQLDRTTLLSPTPSPKQ